MTQEVNEKCEKCGGALIKEGVMHSGNSSYARFKCKSCGNEQMKCEGLI